MRTTLSATLLCAILAPVGLLGASAPAPSAAPGSTAPPEIYHTTVRPLCSALQTKIQPAVGMLLQNDKLIAKSTPMFKDYSTARFNDSKAQQNMTLYHMENLVTPLADNVLAIQKLLNDPTVFPVRARNEEDQRTLTLKDQLLQTLAQQQAALDIINGFVETQNLADMQHEGFGYIAAITQQDTSKRNGTGSSSSLIGPTPNPMHPDPFDNTVINAGLPTNPHELDLTRVPGLTLGYNPVTNLQEGVKWTQGEGQKYENVLAKSVVETVRLCGGHDPAAAPTSKP